MSKHYLVEGKRRFPRLSAYENPRIPADNPQETADALALLKNHWCIQSVLALSHAFQSTFLLYLDFIRTCQDIILAFGEF